MEHPRSEADGAPLPIDVAEWLGDKPDQLWRYLRYLGCDGTAAQDFVQDAFLAAVEKRIWRLPESDAMAWLRATARNLFRYELRRRGRRPSEVPLESLELAWIEQGAGDREHLAALRLCIAQLAPRARHALRLRYGDRASREAMARELGIRTGGVKALLQRLRRRLRDCVEARLGRS